MPFLLLLGPAFDIIKRVVTAIPWKVWVVIGLICAVLYYGHWSRERGRQEVRAQVAIALQAEKARQDKANTVVLEKAKERAVAAEAEVKELQKKVQEVIDEAKKNPNANNVCVSADTVKRLRGL